MKARERDQTAPPGSAPGQFSGWLDAGADPSRASIARVYDYWLGGHHNLVVDRELAERIATLDPRVPASCRLNRAFLGRVVRFLAGQGIRQFVDLGSGIPTVGNVHEVAQDVAPSSRVLYVDRDPVAVAEGRKLLSDCDRAVVIHADIREPDAVLSAPEAIGLIDFSQPVALMFVATLHFVLDRDDPHGIVAKFGQATVPGSYLVVSHIAGEAEPKLTTAVQDAYQQRGTDTQPRSRDEIEGFFSGWDLVEPGLVYAPVWRPDRSLDVPANPERFWFLAGAAIRPDSARR